MTISYPLSLPNTNIAQIRLYAQNNVALSTSVFTYQAQRVQHDGDRWAADVTLPVMTQADAADWHAFITSLRGRYGTFLLGQSAHGTPRGTPGGTPVVNGASQTGYTLVTDGWTVSTTVLKKGDFIQIENRLYMITADATTNGSGQVTLDIWPSLRDGGPADNATITYTNAKGTFRLVGNIQAVVDVDPRKLYTLSFNAEEAL